MFYGHLLTVRGARGALFWAYADAARLGTWTITKAKDNTDWILVAHVVAFDAFRVRQGDLRFTAPRAGGFWCWPVVGQVQIDARQLTARLGQPEQ